MKNSIPKNRILLRGAALALALCLLFSCASCGKKNTALRADLSGRVYTLDPQYCSTALERCLLKNCMEGLLRRLPDGTMAEGCAENYSVSADGLRYTFTLRENLQWSEGEGLCVRLPKNTAGQRQRRRPGAICRHRRDGGRGARQPGRCRAG